MPAPDSRRRPWWAGPVGPIGPVGAIAVAFVLARVIVAVSAWLADRLGGVPGAEPRSAMFMWDGSFYRDLARSGYEAGGDRLRFFPLFGLLGRWLGAVVGGPTIALPLIANVAAVVATWLLWRLVEQHTGDRALATRAAVAFTLFPAAAVLCLPYAEPLAIALGLGAALAVDRSRFARAAVLLLLAGLTRPTSVLLALPMAWLAVADRPWRADGDGRIRRTRLVGWCAVVTAAPVGAAAFLARLEADGHSWRAPLDLQRQARRGFAEPLTRTLEMVADVATGHFRDVYNLAFVAVLVGCLVLAVRAQYRPAWIAYGAAGMVAVLASQNVDSVGRYGFALAPAWAVGAAAITERRWVRIAWYAASSVGLLAMTTQWFRGAVIP